MSNAQHLSQTDTSHSHGSLKTYVIGFVASIVLTLLAFGLLMRHVVPPALILPGIVILGVAQLIVQLIFFMHLGFAAEQRNNTLIFVFTAAIIVIIVGGSLWVMHNANVNMMPMHMSAARAMSRD